ncbi:MAG: hypothetical protein EXR76_18800 [Myxococcales bacterium]|nr:hypothetical protein [Myxococcales bacterium]
MGIAAAALRSEEWFEAEFHGRGAKIGELLGLFAPAADEPSGITSEMLEEAFGRLKDVPTEARAGAE